MSRSWSRTVPFEYYPWPTTGSLLARAQNPSFGDSPVSDVLLLDYRDKC